MQSLKNSPFDKRHLVLNHSMHRTVQSSKHTCPAGAARTCNNVKVVKDNTLIKNALLRVRHKAADAVVSLIVGNDDQEVRRLRGSKIQQEQECIKYEYCRSNLIPSYLDHDFFTFAKATPRS